MDRYVPFYQKNENKGHSKMNQIKIEPIHIPFDTNDSQASDTSYQSSLSSNEENNLGNAEYFREQMSRFFINYPELLNQQLIGDQTNQRSLWGDLANDIVNQAKEEPISLQGIAKRIAFYRQKTQQIDIIDLIVREKDLILKQLDQQSKIVLQQNVSSKVQQGLDKRSSIIGETSDNIYYSWKKKQEVALINQSRKNSMRRVLSNSLHSNSLKKNDEVIQKNSYSTNKSKISKSQFKNSPKLKLNKNSSIQKTFSNSKTDKIKYTIDKKLQGDQINDNKANYNSQSAQLKNILKFQPKTEAAKQLLQQIKKHSPYDEIGIKKTIVNFLSKHRDTMKKNVLSKSSLNERLSKLHIQDSKQLLLFCPLKKIMSQPDVSLSNQTNNFLEILNEISSGHLMKYWKLLQQRKL